MHLKLCCSFNYFHRRLNKMYCFCYCLWNGLSCTTWCEKRRDFFVVQNVWPEDTWEGCRDYRCDGERKGFEGLSRGGEWVYGARESDVVHRMNTFLGVIGDQSIFWVEGIVDIANNRAGGDGLEANEVLTFGGRQLLLIFASRFGEILTVGPSVFV